MTTCIGLYTDRSSFFLQRTQHRTTCICCAHRQDFSYKEHRITQMYRIASDDMHRFVRRSIGFVSTNNTASDPMHRTASNHMHPFCHLRVLYKKHSIGPDAPHRIRPHASVLYTERSCSHPFEKVLRRYVPKCLFMLSKSSFGEHASNGGRLNASSLRRLMSFG